MCWLLENKIKCLWKLQSFYSCSKKTYVCKCILSEVAKTQICEYKIFYLIIIYLEYFLNKVKTSNNLIYYNRFQVHNSYNPQHLLKIVQVSHLAEKINYYQKLKAFIKNSYYQNYTMNELEIYRSSLPVLKKVPNV